MNPNPAYSRWRRSPRLRALLLALASSPALFAQAVTPAADTATDGPARKIPVEKAAGAAEATPPAAEETVMLSPFEVVTDTRGYYSSNTMSGTRFNTKLEDLGSSITVMTKEQMSDFAMLDINDVFLYTAGAEGTGTFTDFVVDRNGQAADNVQLNPTGANRLRGIASANISFNNYEMSGRMPIDPMLIEGIEISRGPNANVFGLGNASGTVNQVAASANLTRDFSRVELRADSYEGYRTTLDVNRSLVDGKLAFRVNGGFNHEGFVRKPSGVNTRRYNGFIKYKPFKNTTITASLIDYRMNGNRPNFTPPRDYVSDWIKLGRATWDPLLQEVHVNGQTYRFPTDTTTVGGNTINAFGVARAGTMSTRANLYVDEGGILYWTTPTTNSVTAAVPTPTSGAQAYRLMQSSVNLGGASAVPGRFTNQPLWTTTPTVSSKSIYDWSETNLSSVNRLMDRTIVYNAQLDQIVFETDNQMLAVQVGALREDNERYARTPLGNSGTSGQSGQLFVDINERNLDGSVNPFFGKTYLAATEPLTRWSPSKWDTYRAQLAYRHDFTGYKTILKWLGVQQFSAYDEYKYRINRVFAYREAMSSSPAWLSTVTTANYARANQGSISGGPQAGPNVLRQYVRYYVGGNMDGRIQRAPSDFRFGSYPFVWGGYATTPATGLPSGGVFTRDAQTLDLLATTDGTGGTNNLKQIIKTPGAVLQSQLFGGKLVTVAGIREDRVYSKNGALPSLVNNNTAHDFARDNQWVAGDYRYNVGRTKTFSIVGRPFRDLTFVRRAADGGGISGLVGQVARNISFTYNSSDNFIPQPPAIDLFLRPLPNVTGKGKDFGIWLPLYDNKFVLRVNRWETTQSNARDGDANVVVQRVLRKDILYGTGTLDAWNIPQLVANRWAVGLTGEALENRVAQFTGIPVATARSLVEAFQSGSLAATNDVVAKGTEIELNFNPTRDWTVSASATETESISSNMSKSVQEWIDQRMKVWTTLQDPELQTNWWTQTYGTTTAQANHLVFVEAPYSVFKQQEGKSKPSIRKYAFKMSTSYSLGGLFENKILKNIKVGGAVRWDDKGAIGYYGKNYAALLAAGQPITELDPNNPVYDPARWYFDAFISYKTKLWANKISATFQLNVQNIQEDGRLQGIGAFPDGTPNAYRIVDPRKFTLSAKFDL